MYGILATESSLLRAVNVDPKKCPVCQSPLDYDEWEDCYLCSKTGHVLYPKDLGEADNPDAGYLHIGEQ